MLLIAIDACSQSWKSHAETTTSSLAAQKQAAAESLQKHTAATQVSVALSQLTLYWTYNTDSSGSLFTVDGDQSIGL